MWFYDGICQNDAVYKICCRYFYPLQKYKQISSRNMWPTKIGNPLFFGQTDFTIVFATSIFHIHYTTSVELRLQKMGEILPKTVFPSIFWGILRGFDPTAARGSRPMASHLNLLIIYWCQNWCFYIVGHVLRSSLWCAISTLLVRGNIIFRGITPSVGWLDKALECVVLLYHAWNVQFNWVWPLARVKWNGN